MSIDLQLLLGHKLGTYRFLMVEPHSHSHMSHLHFIAICASWESSWGPDF